MANLREYTPFDVNYRRKVSMPIRDIDGNIIFVVDVYGVQPSDLAVIPGGSRPMYKAVERIGLDPFQFMAWLWDVPIQDVPGASIKSRRGKHESQGKP